MSSDPGQQPQCSIIIPVLNDGKPLQRLLKQLQPLRRCGCELIVVDGGSTDRSASIAEKLADKLLCSAAGRAWQMNQGAGLASGDMLWFLHADSFLDDPVADYLSAFAEDQRQSRERGRELDWGWYSIRIDGQARPFRLVAALMTWRSRISRIATGDQGIFVRRGLFEKIGGFAELPLMEDVELCKRLRKISRPAISDSVIVTSGRRWQQHGILRTIMLMWWLRLLFFVGVPASRLSNFYRLCSSPLQK